jgi:hypothetical protein
VTETPDSAWVIQQAWNLPIDERLWGVRFLLRDRDTTFSGPSDAVLRAEGVRVIRTPLRPSRANAFAERFVGTVRRECLDHVLIYGRRHLEPGLQAYVAHYTEDRPHSGTEPSRTRRYSNTAGPEDGPNASRTQERARRAEPRVSPGGVIRVVEPFSPVVGPQQGPLTP